MGTGGAAGGEFEYRDFYGHTPRWRGIWCMSGVPQYCRETGKKVCSSGSWSWGADIHTVIGSSFIGTGTHILHDTSPHTPSSSTNNKPTLTVIYTASVWLFRFKPMQQKKNKSVGKQVRIWKQIWQPCFLSAIPKAKESQNRSIALNLKVNGFVWSFEDGTNQPRSQADLGANYRSESIPDTWLTPAEYSFCARPIWNIKGEIASGGILPSKRAIK